MPTTVIPGRTTTGTTPNIFLVTPKPAWASFINRNTPQSVTPSSMRIIVPPGVSVDVDPPTVNITTGVAGKRVSDKATKDTWDYAFQVSEDIQAWELRAVTADTDPRSGTIIESGGAVASNGIISGALTYAEAAAAGVAADGTKWVKFFAQDISGNWSS